MGVQEPIEVICVDRHHIVATWRCVLIVVWRDETLVSSVIHASSVLDRLSADHRSGVALVQVVEEGCRPPNTEERKAVEQLLAEGRKSVKCSSVVFEGEGFKAAIVRGVVAGIAAITRTAFPHRVFARPQEMADFMAPLIARNDPTFAERLSRAIADTRAAAEARVPSVRPQRKFSVPPPKLRGAVGKR